MPRGLVTVARAGILGAALAGPVAAETKPQYEFGDVTVVAATADEPRLTRGVAWLTADQRASGRWWTRSLNTDSWHFITSSGTASALLAPASCGELPAAVPTAATAPAGR